MWEIPNIIPEAKMANVLLNSESLSINNFLNTNSSAIGAVKHVTKKFKNISHFITIIILLS